MWSTTLKTAPLFLFALESFLLSSFFASVPVCHFEVAKQERTRKKLQGQEKNLSELALVT